jgi:hypothetical protein
MMRRHRFWLLMVLFGCTSLWSMAQPSGDELRQLRERYEAYRKQPERLAQLRENFLAYQQLPEDRQKAVRKLDEEMHKLAEKKQTRFWGVLERYADWLDKLKKNNPKAYQRIKSAPDAATRLALIKTERDGEWMQTQPKSLQTQWTKLGNDARAEFVANLRNDERQKHLQWQIAARFWVELEKKQFLPSRLSDFAHRIKFKDLKAKEKDGKFKEKETNKVHDYVTNYLMKYLTEDEKKQLEAAEGRWPDYPLTLVELARKRPSALPPIRDNEEYLPRFFRDLPQPIQDRIEAKKGGGAKTKMLKDLKTYENSPGYAGKVVEFGTNNGNIPFDHEFWPSHFKGLSKPMQSFVTLELIPKLSTKDKKDLEDHSGRWPYYPKKIQELAKKHHLHPPWHILPEADVWHWDRYRRDRQKATTEKAKEDLES